MRLKVSAMSRPPPPAERPLPQIAIVEDDTALRDAIASNEFDTVIGKVRFKNGENITTPGVVSQWQSGEFEVVWPPDRATAPAMHPKPHWR